MAPMGEGRRAAVRRALEELGLDDAFALEEAVDEARVRRAYRKLALKWHPDKQQQQHGAGAEGEGEAETRFKRISASYQLLLEHCSGAGWGDDGDDAFDFDGYCDAFVVPNHMVELWKRALMGEDVEADLRTCGVHRPPQGFGISPFPCFDAEGPEAASRGDLIPADPGKSNLAGT